MLRALTLVAVLLCLPAMVRAETVRIGWLRAPNDLTLARAHGSLEKALAEQGVTVAWSGPFAAAAPAMEAMNAGAIDITAGSSTSSITALAGGVPMVVFAYQAMSPASEAILVPRNSPIRTLKDLEGHTVAVNRGGTGEYLLMRALDRNGVDPSRVRRVYLSPSDSGPSFLAGRVDAWATWDPFVAIAIAKYGGRVPRRRCRDPERERGGAHREQGLRHEARWSAENRVRRVDGRECVVAGPQDRGRGDLG